MPWKEKSVSKLYWSIGEVADELGVNTSLIRYWEKEFNTIKPKRTGKGDRSYTQKDIDQLRRIQHLVKEQGFTLQGAKEQLRNPVEEARTTTMDPEQLRQRLIAIRNKMVALANEITAEDQAREAHESQQ
jgi:DNA-binding transcriptional MerR regulator